MEHERSRRSQAIPPTPSVLFKQPMLSSPTSRIVRPAGYLLACAVILFTCVCGAAQYWRTDLNPIAAPLSIYLTGPGGVYVRAVYDAMALALLLFAFASYRATAEAQRSVLASLLFALAGLALPVVAATPLYAGTPHENLAHLLHGLTAQGTFLTLSFGMLLLSYRWRHDPRLGAHLHTGVILAWLATVFLWLQFFARHLPHGLMQKLLIVLMLLWLAWAARRLLNVARWLSDHHRSPSLTPQK